MFAEFKHTLKRLRGQLIGWGIGLALYGLMMAWFYSQIAGMEDLLKMIESYPEEMKAFFSSINEINTPRGYMDTYYFSLMPMIIGVFVIMACTGLVVGDEEKGILDLVISYPVSRSSLFWGRLAGFTTVTAALMLVSWLGWVLPAKSSGLDLGPVAILLPFVSLFVTLLFFGTLGLLFSMFLPSVRMSALAAAGLLVANFLMMGLASINSGLEPVIRYSPLNTYQGGQAIEGLDLAGLEILIGWATLFSLAAGYLFRHRDIRVGGERNWRLPRLSVSRFLT